MTSLNLKNINKSYGKVEVLKDINLQIEKGEFVVFVGPSGCGKSTLLRLIAGLIQADSGEIFFEDQKVNDFAPAKRGIGMVFQSYALYPHMTVFDNMAFGLKLKRKNRREVIKRVMDAAKILQLDDLLKRKPKELSGGQRQRVAIGRAIVRKPQVFLFDEPLSNLDATLRVQMRIEITKLHNKLKTTMIYVTHDQVEAMTMADKIIVLNKGRIEQIGTPYEVYERPNNIFVAGFIGAPKMNFIEGKITKRTPREEIHITFGSQDKLIVDEDFVDKSFKVNDRVIVGIRPNHIVLDHLGNEDTSESTNLNRFVGTVSAVEYLGNESLIYIKLSNGHKHEIVATDRDIRGSIKVGQSLSVILDFKKVQFFLI